MQAECVRAFKGLALPHASCSGEITPAGSRRLRPTLVAAPVLFAHNFVTVAKTVHPPPLVVLFLCCVTCLLLRLQVTPYSSPCHMEKT